MGLTIPTFRTDRELACSKHSPGFLSRSFARAPLSERLEQANHEPHTQSVQKCLRSVICISLVDSLYTTYP